MTRVLPFSMQPVIQALIAAGACFLGSAIPLAWAISLERRCRRLAKLLRESQLQLVAAHREAAAALDESSRWRAMYYDARGADVYSRRTQLMHPR